MTGNGGVGGRGNRGALGGSSGIGADTEDSAVVANSDNDVSAGRPGASLSVSGTAGAINFQ